MIGRAYVVESVLHMLKAFAEESRPLETGGILVGVLRDAEPRITAALQIRDPFRTSTAYVIPRGSTPLAVDVARERDGRVGYVGDWHSHPVDLPASGTDRTTLRRNARRRRPRPVPTILIVVRGTVDEWEIDAMADDGRHAQPIEIVVTGELAAVAE
jgi:integrative and conjugative element protein (TIGR02256 family)